jgi:hypothetical protein
MVAATSAEDFISLIVWYNTHVFLCRKKESTAHNARRRAAMNSQININNKYETKFQRHQLAAQYVG